MKIICNHFSYPTTTPNLLCCLPSASQCDSWLGEPGFYALNSDPSSSLLKQSLSKLAEKG